MPQSGPSLPTNPSWPSLYNPHSEIFDIPHHDPLQPGGVYLTDAQDIFRFTLYWTFVFYIPAFVICGLYAFINLTFPPTRKTASPRPASDVEDEDEHAQYLQGVSETSTKPGAYPMTPLTSHFGIGNGYQTLRSEMTDGLSPLLSRHPTSPSHGLSSTTSPTVHYIPRRPQKKVNERRTRLTFALLVLLFFLLMSLLGAVISSAIVGYVLAGLYRAGNFYMSTWVPFVWALIQVLVGMLNVWPSVIDFV